MGYIRQLLATYVVRILLVPVGLAYAVLTARALGPEQLGIFAAIGTVLLAAAQLANLGLPIAVTRAAAVQPEKTGALIAGARLTGALCGLTAMAVIGVTHRIAPAWFGAIPLELLLVAAFALPFSLGSAQLQAILLGRRRMRQFNMIEMINRLALLGGSACVLLLLHRGLPALVALTALLALLQWVVYHFLLWPDSSRLRPDLGLLRGMGAVSFRAYLTVLLYFLVLRSDILMINAMLDSRATGVYNVAVQGADALILLPALAGMILLPRIAADSSERSAALTALLTRHIVFIMAFACLVTALACGWVVPALFGSAYGEATGALRVLLPGVFFISIQHVLHQDLSGRDYPWVLPAVWGIVLAINVALNALLLPRFGIRAAAFSSSVAYGAAALLLSRYWLARFPQLTLRDLLVLGAEERRALWGRMTRSVPRNAPERGSA